MSYFPHDSYIGGALELYGEYSELEFEMLARFVKPGHFVIEAGANIGCFTVPLAKLVGNSGHVIAIEPQRIIFQMLCGNLAINGLWNVLAENRALGAALGITGVPRIDYANRGNFGGLSFNSDSLEKVSS